VLLYVGFCKNFAPTANLACSWILFRRSLPNDFDIFVFVFHVKTLGVEPKTGLSSGVVKKKLTRGPLAIVEEGGFFVVLFFWCSCRW
jgi:hypothetical protein